jgi:hypothetical protein
MLSSFQRFLHQRCEYLEHRDDLGRLVYRRRDQGDLARHFLEDEGHHYLGHRDRDRHCQDRVLVESELASELVPEPVVSVLELAV